jgi:hypothetical protein
MSARGETPAGAGKSVLNRTVILTLDAALLVSKRRPTDRSRKTVYPERLSVMIRIPLRIKNYLRNESAL